MGMRRRARRKHKGRLASRSGYPLDAFAGGTPAMTRCTWCPAPALLRMKTGVCLCSSCWERLEPRIHAIDPNIVVNSVSPGGFNGSLPRENPVKIGETEPSVMLAWAPGESSSCGDSARGASATAHGRGSNPCAIGSGPFNSATLPKPDAPGPQDSTPVLSSPAATTGPATSDVSLTGPSPSFSEAA